MPILSFILARTGDLSASSSVTWTLAGSLPTTDLVAGQPTTGTIRWLANEQANKTLDIYVKGNTTPDPSRVCSIQLSNPVNANITTSLASTTITDDDTVVVPPTGSILPTWDQTAFTGPVVTAVSNSDLVAKYAAAQDGTTIRLTGQGVNYGNVTFARNVRVHILSDFPVFGTMRCPATDSSAIRKTNNTSTEALRFFCNDANGNSTLRPPNQRTHLHPTITTPCGDIKFTGVSMGPSTTDDYFVDTSGGQINIDTTNKVWFDNYFVGAVESRHFNLPSSAYGGNVATQLVFSRGWNYADGEIRTTTSGNNHHTDYSWQLYACHNFILEDVLIEGGYNHPISPRYRSGVRDGIQFNRVCLAPWSTGTGNSGGSWISMIEAGQFGDGASRGDHTCGFITATNMTWLANNGISQNNMMYVGLAFENIVGAKIEDLVFDGVNFRCILCRRNNPNSPSIGGNTSVGVTAWTGGLEFNRCIFRDTGTQTHLEFTNPGAGYAAMVVKAANNVVRGNGGVLRVAGRSTIQNANWQPGPNSGLPA